MSLHDSRCSPAHPTDDILVLQGLLTQRLYVNEHDRRLLHALLAETPRQAQPARRAHRRGARRLRAGGAALALSGALALTLGSPLLPAIAASPPPASWAATDRAAGNLAPRADDALLRALLNRAATSSKAAAPAGKADDALLRALLNRAAGASAASAPQASEALAQVRLAAGAVLVIPAAPAAATTIAAAPSAAAEQQATRYYVVKSGDTLSGIAQFYYGNGDLWRTIFDANTDKIRDPNWIYPNQQLAIPPTPIVAMALATSPTPIVSTAQPTTTAPQTGRGIGLYTVQPGDTLSGIAAYAYGNGSSWWGIYQANASQIKNPDLIFPGQVLTIP